MTDPIVQSHLTLDDAWRLTDEMIEAEAEWLPGWLGGARRRLGGGARDVRRTAPGATAPPRRTSSPSPPRRSLLAAACGGSTADRRPRPRPPPAPVGVGRARSAAPPAAGYTGPEATITYSIWGDPAEIKQPAGDRRRVPRRQSEDHGQGDRADWDAYWDKLQTGIAGGDAPDVFAMDGPLFPDYQSRDVLLDLKPFIDRDGYDLTQLADQARRRLHDADGGQFGLPRDLNVVALYYNKTMFDAAGIAYPDETWDWAKLVEVAKQLTIDQDGDGTVDQWGFYTETTDMENYWSSLVWQNGGDIIAADKTQRSSAATRRPAGSSSSRT